MSQTSKQDNTQEPEEKPSALDRAEEATYNVDRARSLVDWFRYIIDWIKGLFGR